MSGGERGSTETCVVYLKTQFQAVYRERPGLLATCCTLERKCSGEWRDCGEKRDGGTPVRGLKSKEPYAYKSKERDRGRNREGK